METLTEQGFWVPMKQKYPKAMGDFLIWIDKYKKDNDWDQLFNAGAQGYNYHGAVTFTSYKTKAPKFYELPIAMQFGIWVQYVGERSGEAPPDVFVSEMKKLIMEGLEITDEELQ